MVFSQPPHSSFVEQFEADLAVMRRAFPRADQSAIERAHAERIRIRKLMRAQEDAQDDKVRFLRDIATLVVFGVKCAASFTAMIVACILIGAASLIGIY